MFGGSCEWPERRTTMGKLEFLQTLSEKLSEELPRSVVISNLRYYESYIDNEVAKGRLLESVMDELGDPYMIARTIIDGQESGGFANQNYADETVYAETIKPENESNYGSGDGDESERNYDSEYCYGTNQSYGSEYGYNSEQKQDSEYGYDTDQNYGSEYGYDSNQENTTVRYHKHGCLIAAIIVILAAIVIISVVGSVISFLWPVLAPVLVVLLVLSIIRDKRR